MNFRVKLLTVLLAAVTVLAVSSCQRRDRNAAAAEDAEAPDTPEAIVEVVADADFSGVMHRDWILSEIRTATESVTLDRAASAAIGFGDIFTIRFEENRVSGVGAPNSFFGPYTLAENRAITLGPMASTLMATFMEPEELTEHQFFTHLNAAVRWDFAEGTLEIHSADEDGLQTALVFVPLGDE